jgi:hypothetical protein
MASFAFFLHTYVCALNRKNSKQVMITDQNQQNEALETIMQGGTPDIPKTVNVPLSYERGGEAYEDPEKDEDGIYEHRPVGAEEGDKWYGPDGEKVWEMGRGGPMKVSQFDDIRMPMFCPECNGIMNGKYDRKFWRLRGMCMDCWQDIETEMRVNGTYELFEKWVMVENKKSWLRDIKEGIAEFEEKMRGSFEQVVNSSGDTVEFDGLEDGEVDEMIENAKEFISNFEDHIEETEQEVEELEEKLDTKAEELI